MKHYGLTPYHSTLPELDTIFAKEYRNVVFLFLDGLGVYNLEKCLPPDSFLRTHLKKKITSVYPPTTAAASTAMYSGLEPCETGWLGWTQYFSEVDKNVTVYFNSDEQGLPAAKYDLMKKFCPYKPFVRLINKHSEDLCEQFEDGKITDPRLLKIVQAQSLEHLGETKEFDLSEIINTIENVCATPGHHYLECYYNQPDVLMHKLGVGSKTVKTKMKEIDIALENLYKSVTAKKANDTVFIITADHGHIDVDPAVLSDYSKITACLKRSPSIDSRTPNFFVKEGLGEKFCTHFKKEFGSDHILLSKQEVINKHIFGAGGNEDELKKQFPDKKDYTDFIGDYVAFATGKRTIFNKRNKVKRGMHAGLTSEEMMVPLIVVE
ncbi:MAG: hypothetical protein BKP49_06155 [Treponema sp. CETP13]|nr:MAG: hypothetical protein BKP49_06155 [Treponema sp. CETP13]